MCQNNLVIFSAALFVSFGVWVRLLPLPGCKISEVTISKCYKKLYKYHKYLLPENILNSND